MRNSSYYSLLRSNILTLSLFECQRPGWFRPEPCDSGRKIFKNALKQLLIKTWFDSSQMPADGEPGAEPAQSTGCDQQAQAFGQVQIAELKQHCVDMRKPVEMAVDRPHAAGHDRPRGHSASESLQRPVIQKRPPNKRIGRADQLDY